MITGTFNGLNIVALPSDTTPGVTAPSSIEWNPQEMVSESIGGFGYQSQIFDWGQSCWAGQVSFPSMNRHSADAWSSFILQCRGQSNCFMFGDPKAKLPKGNPQGVPVVNGPDQTGYNLLTRGWKANTLRLLLVGDLIQIGNRMYKVLDQVNADASGHATLSVWPNLRDMPADGARIILHNCKGLFRLSKNTGNKYSTNAGNYGFSGFGIREGGVA